MKKTVKIIALMLVLVTALGVLASCGRLSGTYTSSTGASYEFSGNNFKYTASSVIFEGTYSIKKVDSDMYILLLVKKQSVNGKEVEVEEPYVIGGDNGTEYFEGEGYIKISETVYNKQ